MILRVERIPAKVARPFVIEHHYSHGIHNGPMTWGLLEGSDLVGVCAFATPSSENVCRSVFGPGHEREVSELHRLVLLDRMPRNTESWFIVRALAGLKQERPQYRAVLSFADATEGHVGTIYQATNAIYTGRSGRSRFYVDAAGRLRHPRQNGHNVSLTEAANRGWRPVMREGKYRYLFLLGTRTERRRSLDQVLLPSLSYPKRDQDVSLQVTE